MNLAEGIDADQGLTTEGDVTTGAAETDSSSTVVSCKRWVNNVQQSLGIHDDQVHDHGES